MRFCTKLFERFKRKVDDLVRVEDVIKETCLTVHELVDAEICWVKYEQTLISSESEKFEKLKGSLNLFYNKSGLFRSQTRIDRSSNLKLNYNSVNPILLRKESYFTKLAVLRSHENLFYKVLESTFANVSLNYWIIKGRQFVKKVLKQCYLCKFIQGKFLLPPKTPSYQVSSELFYPFEATGLNYAGPIYAKEGNDNEL